MLHGYEVVLEVQIFEYSTNSIGFLVEYDLKTSLQRRLNIVASSGKDLNSVLKNANNYNSGFYYSDEVQLNIAKDIARHFYAVVNQYSNDELFQKLVETRDKVLVYTKQIIENFILKDKEAPCSILTKVLISKKKEEILELLSKIDPCQYPSLLLQQLCCRRRME